jgi:hypothetical protein
MSSYLSCSAQRETNDVPNFFVEVVAATCDHVSETKEKTNTNYSTKSKQISKQLRREEDPWSSLSYVHSMNEFK